MVLAGPGAGKTRSLVQSIASSLEEGTSPFMMLATTFSREAALEIGERLGEDVAVRTFHGLGNWIIRLGRKARGKPIPRIATEKKQRTLVERAIVETETPFVETDQVIEALERVRAHGVEIDSLHPYVHNVVKRYFKILDVENLIDFTGILVEAKKELRNSELKSFLQGLHLWVDEAQDINPKSEWPLLQVLIEGSASLKMFASPSQQIYAFRGADWETLSGTFTEGMDIQYMYTNYRSTPEIVAASKPLAGIDAQNMRASKPPGSPVVLVDAINPDMEIDYIIKQISEWQQSGIPLEEIAILCRVSSQLNQLQMLLKTRDIPFQIVGKRKPLLLRAEVNALLGYMIMAVDPMTSLPLEHIINFPPQGIGVRTRKILRNDDTLTWDHLIKGLVRPNNLRSQVVERIKEVLTIREHLKALMQTKMKPAQIVEHIADLAGISDYLLMEGGHQGLQGLEDLIHVGREFSSVATFSEYLREQIYTPRDITGIQLSTLHASKGREWAAVLIPGMHNGIIPLQGSEIGDERNLAFVGLSRAKDHLVLTMNRTEDPSTLLSGVSRYVEAVQWPRI